MNNNPLFWVNADIFLQTFILELIHASEQRGQKHWTVDWAYSPNGRMLFWRNLSRKYYKNEQFDNESYTELILWHQNNIGKFHWSPVIRTVLQLLTRCPLNKSLIFLNYAGWLPAYLEASQPETLLRQSWNQKILLARMADVMYVFTRNPHAAKGHAAHGIYRFDTVKEINDAIWITVPNWN